MYRMILNETSYFGAGSRENIATEAKRRGFKKAFFVTDKDLVRFKEQINAKNEARNWELHGKGQQIKNEKKQAKADADADWASKLF
mgnify:CR=1 FL=1